MPSSSKKRDSPGDLFQDPACSEGRFEPGAHALHALGRVLRGWPDHGLQALRLGPESGRTAACSARLQRWRIRASRRLGSTRSDSIAAARAQPGGERVGIRPGRCAGSSGSAYAAPLAAADADLAARPPGPLARPLAPPDDRRAVPASVLRTVAGRRRSDDGTGGRRCRRPSGPGDGRRCGRGRTAEKSIRAGLQVEPARPGHGQRSARRKRRAGCRPRAIRLQRLVEKGSTPSPARDTLHQALDIQVSPGSRRKPQKGTTAEIDPEKVSRCASYRGAMAQCATDRMPICLPFH